jgi:hypothetical protein
MIKTEKRIDHMKSRHHWQVFYPMNEIQNAGLTLYEMNRSYIGLTKDKATLSLIAPIWQRKNGDCRP